MSNWFLLRDGKTVVNSSGNCSITHREVTRDTSEIIISTSAGVHSFFIGSKNDVKIVYENLIEDLQIGKDFITNNTTP